MRLTVPCMWSSSCKCLTCLCGSDREEQTKPSQDEHKPVSAHSADTVKSSPTTDHLVSQSASATVARVCPLTALFTSYFVVFYITLHFLVVGVMVTVSDLRSKGRRFDSQPFHRQVTTLGKLFTHMCLCHQAV